MCRHAERWLKELTLTADVTLSPFAPAGRRRPSTNVVCVSDEPRGLIGDTWNSETRLCMLITGSDARCCPSAAESVCGRSAGNKRFKNTWFLFVSVCRDTEWHLNQLTAVTPSVTPGVLSVQHHQRILHKCRLSPAHSHKPQTTVPLSLYASSSRLSWGDERTENKLYRRTKVWEQQLFCLCPAVVLSQYESYWR